MNYHNYIDNLNGLESDISTFLKDLDFDIVQFLFLVINNKYNITAWFMKGWLYILNERIKYPPAFLEKFRREED